MNKTRPEMLAMSVRANNANREKYGGTDYFSIIGAMGGRATRGISKKRGVVTWKRTASDRRAKPASLLRSGLEHATMADVLAELDR